MDPKMDLQVGFKSQHITAKCIIPGLMSDFHEVFQVCPKESESL